MTRSTASRKARRQARKAAHIAAEKLTPEQAREKLARWAAAGGDLEHLQRTGQVRHRQIGPRNLPSLPDKLKLTTISDMRARYDQDQKG